MTFRSVGLGGALVALLALSSAEAATIYQYQGNSFDFPASTITTPCDPGTGGCLITNVTVTLEFAAALAADLSIASVTPDAWSISDGLTTITDTTPGIATTSPLFLIQVGTDNLGNIDEWLIDINPTNPNVANPGEWSGTRTRDTSGFIDDQTRYCQSGACSFQGLAISDDNAGTWSIVPVPAAAWLFGSALGLLGWLKRRS